RLQVYAALKQGEQSGFARAVLAHEAQALARVDDEVGVLQPYLGAAAKGQAVCAYHDASCSRVSIRIRSPVLAVLTQTGPSSGKALTKFSYSLPISSTRTPPSSRKRGASRSSLRTMSMPSSPPASAIVGSWRYSGGSDSIEWSLT